MRLASDVAVKNFVISFFFGGGGGWELSVLEVFSGRSSSNFTVLLVISWHLFS